MCIRDRITINEAFVARSNTLEDWVCHYGVDQGSVDPDLYSDCDYGIQRQATGSKDDEKHSVTAMEDSTLLVMVHQGVVVEGLAD